MRKLEENFKQSGGFYKEFRIGDLFESYNGDFDIQKKHLNDKGELVVSAGEQNCGVIGRTDIVAKIFPSNTITCDMFGNTFYRNFKYKMVTHARVFSLHFLQERFNNKIALYIISAMQFLKHKFSFADMCSWNKIQNLTISLPVLPSCNENKFEIAFEYMESYIKELEAERLEELEAYLLTTGLKDYKLTEQEKVILQDFAKLQNEDSKRGGAFSSLEDYLLYGGSLLDSKKQNFITHALSCLTQSALKSLDTSKWAEFRIGDLFEIATPKKKFDANKIKFGGLYPYVARGETNNGIRGYITQDTSFLNPANTISFGQDTATMFYQDKPYFTGDKLKIFYLKLAKLNRYRANFLIASMRKSFSIFSWGNTSFSVKNLQEVKVLLPVLPPDSTKAESVNDKYNIDFAFMESFIKEIQKEHFLSLIEYYHKLVSAYNEVLETNGGALSFKLEEYLSFYESYKTTQAHSTQLQWQEVRIGDLFEVRPTKAYKMTNSKLFATSGNTPVVTNSSLNNGVSGYVNLEPTEKGGMITYSDTTTSEGIFYQPKDFVGYSHVQGLYPLKYQDKWSKNALLYFVCAFRKAAFGRFDYANKFNRNIAREMKVLLPLYPNGEIAFEYIESFIKALQKELIKELVLWNEKELKVAKSLYKNYN